MRCRCGNEITHVPEHLRDLANWVCQQCTNVAPKADRSLAEERKKQPAVDQKKKAA